MGPASDGLGVLGDNALGGCGAKILLLIPMPWVVAVLLPVILTPLVPWVSLELLPKVAVLPVSWVFLFPIFLEVTVPIPLVLLVLMHWMVLVHILCGADALRNVNAHLGAIPW